MFYGFVPFVKIHWTVCSYDIYIFCIHVIPQGKVISESILYTALLLILKYLLNIHIYAPLYQILKEVEYTDIVPVSYFSFSSR